MDNNEVIIVGAKAGTIAGAIMGLLYGGISLILPFITMSLKYTPSNDPDVGIVMLGIVIIYKIIYGLFYGIFFGIIFGLGYAFLHDKIPGKTIITRGMIVGAVYFITASTISILAVSMIMLFSGEKAVISDDTASLMVCINYIAHFITALIFGYLLVWLWEKFNRK